MAKATLIIKTEYLPTRCEICHQADQFDPPSNICTRCSALVSRDFEQQEEVEIPLSDELTEQCSVIQRDRLNEAGGFLNFSFLAKLGFWVGICCFWIRPGDAFMDLLGQWYLLTAFLFWVRSGTIKGRDLYWEVFEAFALMLVALLIVSFIATFLH